MSTPIEGITLRAAAPGDGPAMQALVRLAYSHYVARIGREPAPMVVSYEPLVCARQVLLAYRARELVGMVILQSTAGDVMIENVAVSPQEQGLGLGSFLLAYAEDFARSTGRTVLRLYTNEAMVENLSYYCRRGFVETHRAEEDGFRRVYFSKTVA